MIIWLLVFHFIIFRLYLTLVEVVILILKHATTLQLWNRPEEALTLAKQDYQEAKIDWKIQEYLKTFTPEDSVEKFADFIMATNIGLFYAFVYHNNISSQLSAHTSCVEKTITGESSFGG